ncbi:MAG: serine hydrolase [Myxococcota bacterium]|nr:serine hydrolase [Myxococcota bacterium]
MLFRISIIVVLVLGLAVAILGYRATSGDSLLALASFIDPEDRPELFSTLHEVMPSHPISASSRPRLLQRFPGSFNADYTWEGREKSIDDFFQETRAMGMIVLRDGGILEERYAAGIDRDTPISTWTATRSYLTTLTGIAVEQGVIDGLDDPVKKYVPDFQGTDYGEVPIRDLLNGNSRMDFQSGGYGLIPDHIETYIDLLLSRQELDEVARTMRSQADSEKPLRHIPTDAHVLSRVIQEAWGSERSLVEILQEELWEPFGFGGEAFWVQDPESPAGRVLVRCCLSVRLLEFAQLGQIYLENGSFRGEQYLPADWADMAGSPHPHAENQIENGTEPGYGLGFRIPADSEQELLSMGSFGQSLWIDRANQVVIAHFSSGDGSDGPGFDERKRAYRAIAQAAKEKRPFQTSEVSHSGNSRVSAPPIERQDRE